MPRFKGASGCFNKHDARELGLAAAVIWYDVLDRAEQFDAQKIWYDQKMASERLGIPNQTISRSLQTLQEDGRITVEGGYRPNSSVRTTWITIDNWYLEDGLGENLIPQNGEPKVPQNGETILKDTKENDTDTIGISNVEASSEETIRMKPEVLYTRTKSIFKQRKDIDRKQCVEGIRKLQERLEDDDILAFASYCATEARSKPLVGNDGTEWHPTFFWFTDPNKTDKVVNMFKSTPQLYEEKKKLKW